MARAVQAALVAWMARAALGQQDNEIQDREKGAPGAPRGAPEAAACYGPGAIAVAVVVTLVVAPVVFYVLYVLRRRYWLQRKGKHLVLETDAEKGKAEYAYDNAAFGDITATPHEKHPEKPPKPESAKSKWGQWSPLAVLVKNEKRTLDDSVSQAEVKTVALKSHDFTGLGFNIYGNMREGIFIKDILHRGPASESGKLNAGDRIKSIKINFEHVVYEDALTILSYASPYEVILEAQGSKSSPISPNPSKTVRLGHPLFRSSSTTDLLHIGKASKKRLFQAEDAVASPYSSLQKVYGSNAPTLELKKAPKDEAPQKTESKVQRFGVRVLPTEAREQTSPKSAEQNDNNANIEKAAPPPDEGDGFVRQESGIKRDKNGIPQEVPAHMMNAAVAARRNRKASVEEEVKSPKKPKGRAPAPPEKMPNGGVHEERPKEEAYASDSEDNQSSVNTIELDSSDITIHHSEEELQSRRTASTGDLTKIQKGRKTSTGTLERAQSLDITDTGIPVLNKKRKGGSIDENVDSTTGSSDGLYGKPHKEPRLSLALDGLNTFQRNQLKKSSEWGNLEDAIISLDKEDDRSHSLTNGFYKQKDDDEYEEVAATDSVAPPTPPLSPEEGPMRVDLMPSMQSAEDANSKVEDHVEAPIELDSDVGVTTPMEGVQTEPEPKADVILPIEFGEPVTIITDHKETITLETEDKETLAADREELPEKDPGDPPTHSVPVIENLLVSERLACTTDPFYNQDLNISDDIKVSRHSLNLETSKGNVSSITIGEDASADLYSTALDSTDKTSLNSFNNSFNSSSDTVTVEGPSSLTLQISDDRDELQVSNSSIQISRPKNFTYVTEIQVMTQGEPAKPEAKLKLDPQKELSKIHEIAEEQLKKLPEMRFSTSSYEAPKGPERSSQVDQLRSNFEKSASPPKTPPKVDVAKSRIPVARTPPTSPERRDSRNFDLEVDKDIVAIMQSPVHSTPFRYPKPNKNVSVTSIRSNSKIPSGVGRPPIPPKRYDSFESDASRSSTNGGVESSFKQWVFSPADPNN